MRDVAPPGESGIPVSIRPWRRRIRTGKRFSLLMFVAGTAALTWVIEWVFKGFRLDLESRARWLQRHARRTIRFLEIGIETTGSAPSRGFLICNHLTYLDIVVLSAITPCVFVAKREVRAWPVFGWLASLAGTIYVDRTRRSDVGRVNAALERAAAEGSLLVIFPEGTSSDGHEVLPFKSSLLAVAAGSKEPLTAGCLSYEASDGDPGQVVCYWGDMVFLSHVWSCLSQTRVTANVGFSGIVAPDPDRKALARTLHSEVSRLRAVLSKP
jgi:1-acyl-sn-glycerol-3-phosphate acyltransferase